MTNIPLASFFDAYDMIVLANDPRRPRDWLMRKVERFSLAHHRSLRVLDLAFEGASISRETDAAVIQSFVYPALNSAAALNRSVLLMGPDCHLDRHMLGWERPNAAITVGAGSSSALLPTMRRIEFVGFDAECARQVVRHRSAPSEVIAPLPTLDLAPAERRASSSLRLLPSQVAWKRATYKRGSLMARSSFVRQFVAGMSEL